MPIDAWNLGPRCASLPGIRGDSIHTFVVSALMLMVCTVVALILPSPAHAVRPFVTDDARIADVGQIEGETWFDFIPQDGRVMPVYNALFNVVPTDWLELGVSGGIGWDTDNTVTIVNQGLQGKLLFVRPVDGGLPGLSLVVGGILPWGRGSAWMDGYGGYIIAPVSVSLGGGDFLFHGNLGLVSGYPTIGEAVHRPFWGVGTDIAIGRSDFRGILEVFAGDPFDPLGPSLAGQVGTRWLVSDYLNLDVAGTFARATDVDGSVSGLDWSVQFGVRFLIDAFTRGGAPGDTEGARGMVMWRSGTD